MFAVDRIVTIIKPTSTMLRWLNHSLAEPLTLQNLRKDCLTLLIPEFDGPRQALAYIESIFQPILEAQLIAFGIPQAIWPKQHDLELFTAWFDIEFHSMIYDVAYLEAMCKK